MSSIPGSMFVAPGSCHSSLKKYHQIQKRQQSQEINIAAISTADNDGCPSKAIPPSPIGSPSSPLSPLNKMCKYFRQFSNPGATGIQEFNVPNIQADVKPSSLQGALSGFDNNNCLPQDVSSPVADSPLNSPRSDAGNE